MIKRLVIIALLINMALVAFGTTTAPHSNSFGSTSYHTNPYAYLSIDNVIEVTEVDGNTNMRVHPTDTYMLFDETILFCGRPDEKFAGAKYPFMLTYEKNSHHSVRGVGCHNLLWIDNIVPREELGK